MKMLFDYTRLCISMFIVLMFCQELASYKSRIYPHEKEIELKEGEALKIQCHSDKLLKFLYPNSYENLINTSYCHIFYDMRNGTYYYTFYRLNLVFGDTGWYGCVDDNYESSTTPFDIELNWLYVYVKSNTNLFVEADTNTHLSAVVGDNIVIPCRTTLPDLKPILIILKSNKSELNGVLFDSKIGFVITNLSLEDSNLYTCLIETNDKKQAVNYVLSVLNESLPELKIKADDLFITRGQDLQIFCIIEINSTSMLMEFMDYEFKWNTPQQNNSRKTESEHLNQYPYENIIRIRYWSKLTIFNVTEEDVGDYECVVKSTHDIKMKKKIKIHDPRIKLITTTRYNTSYFQTKPGSFISWRVDVDSLVVPYLEWFKPNGDKIVANNKFEIYERYDFNFTTTRNFEMYNILRITSLSETDSGNYVLQAKNKYITETINFTLNVIDKPILYLTHFSSYYIFNECTEFHCIITSNPPPRITWKYYNNSYDASHLFVNHSTVELTNVTQRAVNNPSYKFKSVVKMLIKMPGIIECKACNDLGCDSKTEYITVFDPLPPFFIQTNMNKTKTRIIDVAAKKFNAVILQCFVEGKPQPTVNWYKDNTLLEKNNQYLFKYNQQEFHIKYLTIHDSGKYSCRASNSMGIIETYQQITMKNSKWNVFDVGFVTSILILSFILIVLTIYIAIEIYSEKKIKTTIMEINRISFEEGAIQYLNPNLRVDDQTELLPYNKKWEFPRERLKLREQLGNGNFGVVMKAEAIGIHKNENITTVAVKMVRRTTNLVHIRALASELKIMVHLGKHLNIVNLLGACTKNISKCELLMIVEYCHFGNLRDYLLKHRNYFINQIDSKTGKLDINISMDIQTTVSVNNDSLNASSETDKVQNYWPRMNHNSSEINLSDCVLNSNSCQPERRLNYCDNYKDQNLKPICTQDLLSWAFQVARGMEYLSQRKVLHGDLAARNVLLTEDNVVKICDFGLAKKLYRNGNYKKKSKIPVPVKWMAIESIRDRVFSTQSDVWSFGIMLWEFFTLAKTPYPGMEVEKQYQKLIEGYRMEQPDYANREIYDIMLQCWIAKPTLRPNFTDLVESIGNLLEESVRMYYITLNNPYMDINTMSMNSGKRDYLIMMSAPDHMVPSFLANNDDKNMSLSKEMSDLSYSDVRFPKDESEVFRSRQHQDIEFLFPMSVSEHSVELSSIPKHEEEPYLKPIDVHERRAEFLRQRQAMKNQMVDRLMDQNSVYCNTPQNSCDKAEGHELE